MSLSPRDMILRAPSQFWEYIYIYIYKEILYVFKVPSHKFMAVRYLVAILRTYHFSLYSDARIVVWNYRILFTIPVIWLPRRSSIPTGYRHRKPRAEFRARILARVLYYRSACNRYMPSQASLSKTLSKIHVFYKFFKFESPICHFYLVTISIVPLLMTRRRWYRRRVICSCTIDS